jgi:hypothetical protein
VQVLHSHVHLSNCTDLLPFSQVQIELIPGHENMEGWRDIICQRWLSQIHSMQSLEFI